MGLFDKFFREEDGPDPDLKEIQAAQEILSFAQHPYYEKFLEELDRDAGAPLAVGNHMDMIQAAVRSNTLREIRSRLANRVKRAEAALTEIRERQAAL